MTGNEEDRLYELNTTTGAVTAVLSTLGEGYPIGLTSHCVL